MLPYSVKSLDNTAQYSLRAFPRLDTFPLRQNCFAPDNDGFLSDFWLLRRRRADARQGEKGKKRRKDALSGVFALVDRWYGRLFLPHAQRIISEYDSALQKIEAEKTRLSSSLHIAYLFDVIGNRMGKIFDSFLSICPDVELSYDLIDAVTPTGVYMELHPDTDIVINYLCEPLLEERYCTRELYTEPLCLIVKKEHPLAEQDAIFLREIQQESLIECAPTQHGFYRTQLRAALKDAGSSFIHSRDAKSLKQTLVMIESGLGSTIAPWRYGRYNFPNLKAIPIEDDSSQIPVAAIWRKDNLNPNIGKILKNIEREL